MAIDTEDVKFKNLIKEAIEDIALSRAIKAGISSKTVPKKKILILLNRKK